jgi:hypothetical protein
MYDKDDIPHNYRAFLDRYFSGTYMLCFSQSSLLEHLLLPCDTQMYYVIRLACCRLCVFSNYLCESEVSSEASVRA